MKLLTRSLALALLIVGLTSTAAAQSNAFTQDVTITVEPINVLSVTSSTVALTISTATPGSAPDDATDNSTSYSITTNGTNKKLTGALDLAYASGISLAVNLTAPTGGTSAGEVTLTTTAQNLVTGIASLAEGPLTIAYRASATPGAAPNSGSGGETKTVTITLTDM